MAKVFDATLNELIIGHAADWAALLCPRIGIPTGTVELLDTDLATTLQADCLFRIGGSRPSIIHLELEGNPRLEIPNELLRYNVHVHGMYGLPVETVILLLRPKVNPSDMTGEYSRAAGDGQTNVWFKYRVIRLWEEPMAPLMSGGLGTRPLALLTNEATSSLDSAFNEFQQRLQAERVSDNVKKEIVDAMLRLLELRHSTETIQKLYEDLGMKTEETTMYRLMVSQELRRTILRQGTQTLGTPPADVEPALKSLDELERLRRIVDRVHEAASWDDLLATP